MNSFLYLDTKIKASLFQGRIELGVSSTLYALVNLIYVSTSHLQHTKTQKRSLFHLSIILHGSFDFCIYPCTIHILFFVATFIEDISSPNTQSITYMTKLWLFICPTNTSKQHCKHQINAFLLSWIARKRNAKITYANNVLCLITQYRVFSYSQILSYS